MSLLHKFCEIISIFFITLRKIVSTVLKSLCDIGIIIVILSDKIILLSAVIVVLAELISGTVQDGGYAKALLACIVCIVVFYLISSLLDSDEGENEERESDEKE